MVSKVLLVLFAVLVLTQAVLSLNPHYLDEGKPMMEESVRERREKLDC